jgi:hypothetical protein
MSFGDMMRAGGLDKLARLFERHEHTVRLDGGAEARVRLYHARLAAELAEDDADYQDEPPTLEEAITGLVEAGLDAEEREAGLIGSIFGDVVTIEEYERLKAEREERT